MRPFTSRSAVILAILFIFTAQVPAQDLDNVTVSGTVTDEAGALIVGAEVVITAVETSLTRRAETDNSGQYKILQLPPGSFTVQVSFTGFSSAKTQTRNLLAGQNARLDFTLSPQAVIADTVLVTAADRVAVDTTRTVVGGTVDRRELESLPLHSRSALDLVFTLPGVTEEPLTTRELAEDRNANHSSTPEEAGKFGLAGGPAYSNNLTLDGLDNNDDRSARERFEPSIEAVDEVQVISNQFAAEYGRASGGRINLRTRGGSSSFHGRAYYFFRDEALNANTFRNNTLGLKRLPLQEHNPGFTFGGPLVRRKNVATFFFTSYEYDTLLDHAVIDTLLPIEQNARFPLPFPTDLAATRMEDAKTPALSSSIAPFVAVISTPFRSHKLTTRIDHQFSQLHNSSFVLHLGRLNNLRPFNGGNRLADSLQGQRRNSESVSYTDNFVFTNSVLNQFRVQFSQLRPALKSVGEAPVVLITINDSLESDDAARRSGTIVAGNSTVGSTDRREVRWQFQNTATVVRNSHNFKIGIDYQRINSTFTDLSDATGTYTFASAGDFIAGIPNRFRQNFLTSSTQRNSYLALFWQDEWRVRDGLMLTFGLRYERESILDDTNNFGPRLSLAFDPWRKGNTVLRFGAGVFYNRALLRTVDDFTLGNQQLFFDTNALQDDSGRLLSGDARRAFIASHLQFPSTLKLDSPLVEQFAVRNSTFIRRLDPNLRLPESYQGNLGVEHNLGNGFVVEANFTLNRGLHLWREFNVNAPILPLGFETFAHYLASQDFSNFRLGATGLRPLYNAANAGELVRFALRPSDPANPNAVVRISEFGLPISIVNLNSVSSTTAVEVALAALNELRPDPGLNEVEKLVSAGNSSYEALTVELRQRLLQVKHVGVSFRTAYTLSRLTDDGVVNTSDALVPGAFHLEHARSLLDRRHRFVFAGTFDLPGALRVSPVVRLGSGAPFNISLGGVDRNLDDVGNDRPNFFGDLRQLHWRLREQPLPPTLLSAFALPTIGEHGNLPRNAGMGPGLFFFDLSVSREFRVSERLRVRPVIEFDNVLNKTVFSFGSEFINFNALSTTATEEQRQAFSDSFLVPTRTLRQRQIRVGVRMEF
jgi:hypothetical protein